ncbi:MAG: DUF481 domain-containing protein [Candidatus Hydrogenedentes bacterium]|nr:DUF481 domain-containing protein [Candidatus Hydrogenedentota bacterium]
MSRAIPILVLTAQAVGWGDILVLRGGDHLTGEFLRIGEGVLTFRTTLAGRMVVPLDQVQSLRTSSNLRVSFMDGITLTGQLSSREGANVLVPDGDQPVRSIDLTTIAEAAPAPAMSEPPPNLIPELPRRESGGAFETGVLWRASYRDSTQPFTRLTFEVSTDRYEFFSTILLELADEDAFPQFFRALAEWKFRTADETYPELSVGLEPKGVSREGMTLNGFYRELMVGLERNLDQGLFFRSDLSFGLGYAFAESEKQGLTGEVGIQTTLEYYDAEGLLVDEDAEALRRSARLLARLDLSNGGDLTRSFGKLWNFAYYAEEDRRREELDFGLRLHLEYRRQWLRRSTLTESLLLYPSFADGAELRARSESTLVIPVASDLKLKLDLIIDFESDPEFRGVDEWRSAIGAGLVWNF